MGINVAGFGKGILEARVWKRAFQYWFFSGGNRILKEVIEINFVGFI
ncbi:MAG: hypothetical protein NTY48_05775 [Candidatus Diapherotrites archaeon]|nr:hypothetical protein [Candidatus Diapherotrites archaeon]